MYMLHTCLLSLPLDRNKENGAPCCDYIEREAQEEIQTFNPETTVGMESTKRRIGREREGEKECVRMCEWESKKERDTFSMSESKVTIFLPTFRKKYVFIISFIFDYIPFVIEISAPLRETPFCRKPSIALRDVSTSIIYNKFPWYIVRLAAETFFFPQRSEKHVDKSQLRHACYVCKNCGWIVYVPLLSVDEIS